MDSVTSITELRKLAKAVYGDELVEASAGPNKHLGYWHPDSAYYCSVEAGCGRNEQDVVVTVANKRYVAVAMAAAALRTKEWFQKSRVPSDEGDDLKPAGPRNQREKRVAELIHYQERLRHSLKKKREKLRGRCSHPTNYRREYVWEHDNGYGVQTKCIGHQCDLCLAKDPSIRDQWFYPEAFEE